MLTPAFSSPPDCQACGACCASLRVDFSVQELQSHGGCVPDGLAERITGHCCRLRGTDWSPPRCTALGGRLGERVSCGIYPWRPSPCREFEAGSDACERARRRLGIVRGTGRDCATPEPNSL